MRRVVDQVRLVDFVKRNSVVDAYEALRKSISELSKDHKDCSKAKGNSQTYFDGSCHIEDKGDT